MKQTTTPPPPKKNQQQQQDQIDWKCSNNATNIAVFKVHFVCF